MKLAIKKSVPVLLIIGSLVVIPVAYFIFKLNKTNSETVTLNQVLNAEIPNLATNTDKKVTLKNGEVVGVYESDGIGRWSIEMSREHVVQSDFNDNGKEDVATIVHANGGGSGIFTHLVLFENKNREAVYTTDQYLGDRIKINNVSYENGIFSIDMITQGPNEGLCCGTLNKIFKYKLANNVLVEVE